MKKITKTIILIIIAVCTLLLPACAGGNVPFDNNNSNVNQNDNNVAPTDAAATQSILPESKAFEAIPEGAGRWIYKHENNETPLMTFDEIQHMNSQIRAASDSLVDILNHELSMSGGHLEELIYSSSGPDLPKYDENGQYISQSTLDDIRVNRNLNAVEQNVELKRGVTVQRTDIRALPTEIEFYNNSDKQDHDRMQETELSAGSAVIILHTSSDGEFYFIQAYHYAGWVNSENVAIAETEEAIQKWELYAKLLNMDENSIKDIKFAVITEALLEVNGIKLSMGTALPLCENQSGNEFYDVWLPNIGENGELSTVSGKISTKHACVGFAEYSLRNFYTQAFKYVGIPYGWGGMKDGIDCSGYVLNVFKTFGFVFPRNTGEQNSVVGNCIFAENMDASEKKNILNNATVPTVIYISGHAMIYLGEYDGEGFIIHAPGGGRVCEATYDNYSSIISICIIGKNNT